jgi:FkbM family methyltransferase
MLVRELRTRRAAQQELVTLDYTGATIRMKPSTRTIARLRLHPVAKEPWTVSWIERNLRSGDVLYDIGANVGDYALIAAKVAPGSRVVAFEPGAANFATLCENIVLNDVAESVIPLPVVLGEASRMGTLGYSRLEAGSAKHALDDHESSAYVQPVLVSALDDLVAHYGLPAPTLVKLDVDGAEAAVLAGARAILERPELRSVIVEVETANTAAVLEQLKAFELVERFDTRDGVPLPDVWYGVFERR